MKSGSWTFESIEALSSFDFSNWISGGSSQNLWVNVFFDQKFARPELLKVLRDKFPTAVRTGCSTSGEIESDQVREQSLVVSVLQFKKARIKKSDVKVVCSEESFRKGQELAKNLAQGDLRSVMILSQGLTVNGSELARGLTDQFEKMKLSVVISGGLAGDGDRFQTTAVYSGEGFSDTGIVAVGLYGESLNIKTGFSTGWEAFGPARRVTMSKGNVLYEIDDQPALDLYKAYLGAQAEQLPSSALCFPLMVTEFGKSPLVRTILAVDEKAKSLIFAGDVPQGASAQLMRTSFQKLLKAAEEAGQKTGEGLSGLHSPHIFAVSCVGRKLVLGQRIDEEVEAFLKSFPKNTSVSGFYSYGELAPSKQFGCDLHNQTMTLTLIDEAS